jgi:hypothetical protein
MNRYNPWILGIIILLLPLSIAGIAVWLPGLEHPGKAFLLTALVWTLIMTTAIFISLRWRKTFRDYALALVLLGVFLVFPVLGLILLANRVLPSAPERHRMELVERHDRGPGDQVWLFLWDQHRLRRYGVNHRHPAARAQPGDSIDLTIYQGGLGLPYTAYAEFEP